VIPLAGNGFGLGEGGLVGCSILAVRVCPLLPNPCYRQYGFLAECLIEALKEKKKKCEAGE